MARTLCFRPGNVLREGLRFRVSAGELLILIAGDFGRSTLESDNVEEADPVGEQLWAEDSRGESELTAD